jgi:hypothetical protein
MTEGNSDAPWGPDAETLDLVAIPGPRDTSHYAPPGALFHFKLNGSPGLGEGHRFG